MLQDGKFRLVFLPAAPKIYIKYKKKGGSEAWKRQRAEPAVGGIRERCWAGSVFVPLISKSCGTEGKMVLLTPKNPIALGKSGKQLGIKRNLLQYLLCWEVVGFESF